MGAPISGFKPYFSLGIDKFEETGVQYDDLFFQKHVEAIYNSKVDSLDIPAFLLPFELSGDVNRKISATQSTLLHHIAKDGRRVDLARKVIEMGADLTAVEADPDQIFFNTALHWAIANAHLEMSLLLIEAAAVQKASLDCVDKVFKNGPIHLAIGKGYREVSLDGQPFNSYKIVEALLDGGAEVDLPGPAGNTPLHLACMRRDFALCELLIGRGASPDLLNSQGMRPSDCLRLGYKTAHDFFERQVFCFRLDQNEYEDPSNLQRLIELFLPQ